ncbi:MAG TPA: C1 family peptidase [Bacteroidia bacterium]|jgi:C1A family cysteine protease|nr:C1 family peptidase [Bacteroidia bacterium]
MKKTNYFFLTFVLIAFSFSMFGQNFVRVDQSQSGQAISLSPEQVLEIQLPATPSNGYAWYLQDANNNITQQAGVLQQVGDWEFVSSHPEQPVGAAGTQIIRFISNGAGKTDMNFIMMRPSSKEVLSGMQYNVSVTSAGAYVGTYKAPVEEQVTEETTSQHKTNALPSSFSWAAQNKCSPVKNQASCGSCWAFAACGVMEADILRFDGVTRNLSEQWFVNCSQYNCDGGWCPADMFKSKGAVYEADEPYKAANGTCKASYTYHEKIISYKEIGLQPTTDAIKQAIYTYGPVWVCVNAGSNFNNYSGGVLTKTDAGDINHAVVLVGWDDANSCWVMRNSWGSSWGESGYMRIKWGISKIGYKATYFVYKDPTTGIDDVTASNQSATVYPNPMVDGRFTVNLSNFANNQAIVITVTDVQGRVVARQQEKQNSNVEINAETFSSGMYFVNIATEGQTETYKIVK